MTRSRYVERLTGEAPREEQREVELTAPPPQDREALVADAPGVGVPSVERLATVASPVTGLGEVMDGYYKSDN